MASPEPHNSTFEQSYLCYPVSFIDKSHLERGDKIIMPPSALDRLASLQIDYPMLFELRNPSVERVTHCGVLEFVAEEGFIYLPYWMMENMLIQEGDIVQLRNVSLAKGTYVKLQPHTKDFLDITNPKAILETTLRNYSCLTKGDTIMVGYNNKKYYIDIIDTKPSLGISIIETDCEVDFAPPLDYREPEKPAPSSRSNKTPHEAEDEPARKKHKFNPFSGSARRLDGKPSTVAAESASDSLEKQSQPEAPSSSNDTSSKFSANSRARCGKLVFGSTANQPRKDTPKVPPTTSSVDSPQKDEEPTFQAFTGKKYSLKG